MKNEALFTRIKKLVATERRIGTAILDCLYEIERRRAYTELRYDGLFTYCVKELGFTDAQAYQRIQAMRALKEIPELKPRIESGALSVSAVAKVQAHFRKEARRGAKVPPSEKRDLFLAMENLTSKEVEAKLAVVKGEAPKEKLVLEMDSELAALWKRAKDLAAHRSKGEASEVLKILTREWLAKNDPAEKVVRSRRAVPLSVKVASPSDLPLITPENRRAPSASLKREIWKRDDGKCSRCESRHALEVDHILPFAAGGGTALENLRLLCRACNQFLGRLTFGTRSKAEDSGALFGM